MRKGAVNGPGNNTSVKSHARHSGRWVAVSRKRLWQRNPAEAILAQTVQLVKWSRCRGRPRRTKEGLAALRQLPSGLQNENIRETTSKNVAILQSLIEGGLTCSSRIGVHWSLPRWP